VVGPNGCGKSNLVEALRWVMGETSHKSLRAADMDDVIFSGTNNRPGRNNAEVAIQVDNSARKAPAQFNEHDTLDVSRRIEREQGSTYRINGREVRARDVHILFADASTGSRSPALVHQGRIGEIIQAKARAAPARARGGGRHRRPARAAHEAELRLRAAEQNLARLEDVIGQLAGQIDALKRQARQAIRYARSPSRCARPRPPCSTCVGSPPMPSWRRPKREGSGHPSSRRADRRAGRGLDPPGVGGGRAAGLRDGEAKAAAALQRLVMARERSSARRPAPGSAWPSSTAGSFSSATTSSASNVWRQMPRPRSAGSAAETRRCDARPPPTRSGGPASTSA
jgi:chromosome segregation protein